MAKQQILLVDADSSSARLLEVSLRSAGFTVAVASSAESALAKLEHGAPDLILTDTRLPGADGFVFVQRLRARADLTEVPVVFLTEQGALDDKLRGLELGVDDYLAKPIMVREVVTRVQLLLARKRQQRIATEPQVRTRFSGSLEDVAVVDLLQTIAVSGKSGVASVKHGEREAWLYFDRGQIIDAEVGDLQGEEAVYRAITWTSGVFDLEFRAIERPRVIEIPQQALLMEGLRRVDELGRLAEQLPPQDAVVDIDHDALASRLKEIPDELNGILRLIDGKRSLVDLIDASPFDDLSTLTVLSKFYFEGLLLSHNPEPVEWAPGSRPSSARQRESAPPSSAAAIEPVPALVPSQRSAQAPPSSASLPSSPAQLAPSSVPRQGTAGGEPASDSQRFAPAARQAIDCGTKLTPKGIVNVGEGTPSPPKAMPSPFRAANDVSRRSPIPMPIGSTPRANGASGHALAASHTNGVAPSRTMYGLTAAPHEAAPSPREDASVVSSASASSIESSASSSPPSSRPTGAAEPSRPSLEPAASRATTARPLERSMLDAPTRPAPPPSSPRPSVPTRPAPAPNHGEAHTSAPGSHPEPEHEFFEAGDEGTYAGGPRSDVPVRYVDAGSEDSAPPPGTIPSRRAPTRRGLLILAGVLGIAALLLVLGVWRRFVAQQQATLASETTGATTASEPPPAAAVKQSGNTGEVMGAAASDVAAVQLPASVGADAGAPTISDGSAPFAAVAPAPAPALGAAPAPTGRSAAAAAATAPRAATPVARRSEPPPPSASKAPAAPRPPAPRPASESSKPTSPKPPTTTAETPFVPPLQVAPSKLEPKPGDKPPTASYPLR